MLFLLKKMVRPEGDIAKLVIQSFRDWDATLKRVGFQWVNYIPPEPHTRASGMAACMKNDRIMDKAYPEIKNFPEYSASVQPSCEGVTQ